MVFANEILCDRGHREGQLMRSGTTALLIFVFSCSLGAENLEKSQKKELESRAKAIIAEAKGLEKSGQLAEAHAKYAESQAMIETKDAADAIKHLDDEIHKRLRDVLNESRKFYESRRYKEATAALEEGTKLGASQGVLSSNLALSYYQLGQRDKAVEHLDRAIEGTADPKEKLKLQQLLTSFTTGEEGTAETSIDRDRILQFNRLADSIGFDASLGSENDEGVEDEKPFSQTGPPSANSLPRHHSKQICPRRPAIRLQIINHG